MSQVIAIVNEKGGAGKTTTIVECAYQAGIREKTVLVIDLDPQANLTDMVLGERLDPSIFDLFIGTKEILDVIKPASDHWPNVLVVPGSPRMATVDGHLGNRSAKDRILRKILLPIRDRFDLVLIDLGPAADYLTINALVAADVYHIPADLSEYTLAGVQTTMDLANDVIGSGANPTLRFSGVHISGFHKAHSHGVRNLSTKLDALIGGTVSIRIPHSSKVIESQGQHKPVGMIDPDGRVSLAYQALTHHFLGATHG